RLATLRQRCAPLAQHATLSARFDRHLFRTRSTLLQGYLEEADKCSLPPLLTLVTFSAISLICGFIYSKFIVFRDAK
ncbi:primosomal replication protein, partial [Salmonella enterica subsp. enterica serovar Kentucky]|nr:primosomal replication protein [Salmonella enterica subsp. enterica serovar Kentucky]